MGRQPGHAAGLSAGQLAAQALAIVDQEGLQALTLRKLARWVGVEPMSIYHYFPNKDALLDGVWDEVLSEAALPASYASCSCGIPMRCPSCWAAQRAQPRPSTS